jgi:hypothetical protein
VSKTVSHVFVTDTRAVSRAHMSAKCDGRTASVSSALRKKVRREQNDGRPLSPPFKVHTAEDRPNQIYFLNSLSHRIFRHMNEILNIDKK